MSDNKKIVAIDYTHRDYESIREDLVGIAERFYPDTFQDFSEGSFGSMMLDTVAYVGDQLSFYLDYNVNEMFLDTSFQFSNIVRHGRILGYNYTGRPSLHGSAAFFVLVPSSATAIGPDRDYIPILKRGSTFKSQTGTTFILQENVNFADPANRIVSARVDDSTGATTHYAIKAYGTVVSGKYKTETVKVGDYTKFLNIQLKAANVSEIISVHDTQGNEYFEVQNLAQDIIYREVSNRNFKDDNVPSILKPVLVNRKFVLQQTPLACYLQFGSGKEADSNIIANPQQIAMDSFGKDYISDTTFDPTAISKEETLGTVPVNTTLSVVVRTTDAANSNIRTAALNKVVAASLSFENESNLNNLKIRNVQDSIEINNEKPIMGNVSELSSNEVKRRIYDTFSTQNRAVTQIDYENLVYRMPNKFGAVTRCSVQKDPNSVKRNMNLYVISEDSYGFLLKTNSTIKNNLKIWLNEYKMLNDTIDIIDPYIINIGINFVIKAATGTDRFEVLANALSVLKQKYKRKGYIGEHLMVSDIYRTLKDSAGILDVSNVKYTNITGLNYSGVEFNINKNTSPDGSYLVCPKNAIFEIKFPDTDIVGKVI